MKNLSIEEKAKHYDAAIERAKNMLNDGTISNNTIVYLQDIFPELNKNEDDKMRKDLIAFLEDIWYHGKNANFDKWGKSNCSDWIIWLKKQCDQKSNPYSGVSFEYNGHTWGMCARDGGVEIGYDNQLIANINPIREKDEFDNLSKSIDNKK